RFLREELFHGICGFCADRARNLPGPRAAPPRVQRAYSSLPTVARQPERSLISDGFATAKPVRARTSDREPAPSPDRGEWGAGTSALRRAEQSFLQRRVANHICDRRKSDVRAPPVARGSGGSVRFQE